MYVPGFYLFFYITLWVGFIAIFLASVYTLYVHFTTVKAANKWKPAAITLICICFGAFFRLVWLLDCQPNSTSKVLGSSNNIYSSGTRTVFIKLTQLVMFAAVLFMILVWKDVVDKSKKMSRADTSGKLQKQVWFLTAILAILAFPLAVLAAYGIAPLITDNLSNLIFLVYMMGMVVGALRYAFLLSKLLENMTGSMAKNVRKIKTQCFCFMCCFVFGAFGIVFRFTFSNCTYTTGTYTKYMIFLTSIHVLGELPCHILIYLGISDAILRKRKKPKAGTSTVTSSASAAD